MSVRSRNYQLVGNASERDIRSIAEQLELFREIFVREFEGSELNSPIPTTVIVFKSDSAYRPYKPIFRGQPAEIAGHFQYGSDVNYIALTTERRVDHPYAMIFHESVHLLVGNKVRTAPGWFNEGLAEYFSTFMVVPEKKGESRKRVMFGMPSLRHILMLRQNKLLPLNTLFRVDQNSPYYNEHEKSTMFYAQSWALVHYLTHGQEGRRKPQLARFLELLAAAVPVEESFKKAFDTDYATLEKELKDYVLQDTYQVRLVPYGQNAGSLDELKGAPITEAEAVAYLGDMLLHADRLDEAEKHLLKALNLAPDLSIAQASMGMLRVRQQDFADAKLYLQQAIKANPQSYLAQYYYANALSREGMGNGTIVTSYSPESAEQMRGALQKAIEIAPGFPESYRLLAFVNLITNTQLDESIELLQHALKLSPGSYESTFILAQVHMRRQEYKLARAALEQIITGNSHAQLRQQARELLEEVAISEKYLQKQ